MDFSNVPSVRDAMRRFDEENLQALGSIPAGLEEFNIEIPLRDGHKVPAWITRPLHNQTSSSPSSLVVLFHGGDFTLGTELHMRPYARGLASLFGAVVVSATYRLAPEHKFPTGPLDAWDVLEWSANNAADLQSDPEHGFIVGGISAGGNLAAVLTQLAAERGLSPPLTGQWSCVPLLEPHGDRRSQWFSRAQNQNAALLSTHDQNILDGYYGADIRSPLYSPLNSSWPLHALPKTYLQICGADPLRDDGLILAKALQDAGVELRVDLYPGLPHGFWAHMPQLNSSKRFMVDLAKGFGWILGQDVDTDSVENVLKIR